MRGSSNRVNTVLALAAIAILASMAIASTGCSANMMPAGGTQTKMDGAMQASNSGAMGSSAMADDDTPDPNSQVCESCATGTKALVTTGTVEMVGGKQVVNVSIKDGTYSPNNFVAKAGIPVTVVFTVEGKDAKGCLSNPTFKSLNKTMSVRTGDKSLDLGALSAGTYKFACEMGMNVGQIVVE